MSLKFELIRPTILIVSTLDLYSWAYKNNSNSKESLSGTIEKIGLNKIFLGYENGYTNLKITNQKLFAFSIIKYGFQVNDFQQRS